LSWWRYLPINGGVDIDLSNCCGIYPSTLSFKENADCADLELAEISTPKLYTLSSEPGLGFQVNLLQTVWFVPSSLGNDKFGCGVSRCLD
jgi:hypothetical protein